MESNITLTTEQHLNQFQTYSLSLLQMNARALDELIVSDFAENPMLEINNRLFTQGEAFRVYGFSGYMNEPAAQQNTPLPWNGKATLRSSAIHSGQEPISVSLSKN